ncbi:hypothetical protein [Pseudobacteriovorax antillogorgiicola]|uniref:Uncharacterized protein n=1 Tax=Pseudobacteriovorax antillogorgiicola TaxID=1513793 RepID=A0A1Y6C515_9BACT|nr:hypothetical protein [Pseudobacteriovorax antillogorgiicola]TCS49766.1 hypothetical protein EDD56_11411 [Pseudobacteriovorax antillogorgiicola]SMF42626.1 hypothetical protein SAMN06296036_11310 [Pseudobacteriovorax antillogorgiicola]
MGCARRFRVLKNNGTICLFGILDETVNLNIMAEHCSAEANNRIDLSNLESCSWNALLILDRFLESHCPQGVTFEHVPSKLFDSMKLLPNFQKLYTFDSINLDSIDSTCMLTQIEVTRRELESLSQSCSGYFLQPDDDHQFLGNQRYFLGIEGPADCEKSPWLNSHRNEFRFWHDYLSFCQSTLTLSLDLLESLKFVLDKDLGESLMLSQQSCIALSLLNFDTNCTDKSAEFQKTLKDINEYFEQAFHAIKEIKRECFETICQIERLALREDFSQAKPLYELIGEYLEKVARLRNGLDDIENLGVESGSLVFQMMNHLNNIKSQFSTIEDMEKDQMKAVREALDVMDILSAKSWKKTWRVINRQFQGNNTALFKLNSSLQGFDLLRQIIDHRLNEVDLAKNQLQSESDWEGFAQNLYKMVNKSVVTDQEKYSRDFYLADAKDSSGKGELLHAPGDIVLF